MKKIKSFKNIMSILLMLILMISTINLVYAKSTKLDEDEKNIILENYTKNDNKDGIETTNLQNDSIMLREDIETLDKLYEEFDRKVGEIIQKYNEDESNYVELATSFEKKDRDLAMYKIMEIYDNINLETEKNYLLSYFNELAPYSENDEFMQFYAKSKSDIVAHGISGYNRNAAINYAAKHYNSPNTPTYPYINHRNVGTDCANFISQSLHAGGISMRDNWYIYRKNTTYPRPTTVAQLDYSWTLSDPSPWISAREFASYWEGEVTTLSIKVDDYRDSNKAHDIYRQWPVKGDVIVLEQPYLWYYRGAHVMLINDYINSKVNNVATFQYSAHNRDTKTGDLYAAVQDSAYDDWQITFYDFY